MIVYRIARQISQAEREDYREFGYHTISASAHPETGFWHGPHAWPGSRAEWSYSMPCPDTDKPFHDLQRDEVCGCTTIDKLLEWFGRGIETMQEEGFRFLTCYLTLKSRHVVQQEQIVFRWADAVIVKNEPVKVLLERMNHEDDSLSLLPA